MTSLDVIGLMLLGAVLGAVPSVILFSFMMTWFSND